MLIHLLRVGRKGKYLSDGSPVLCGGQQQWLGGGLPGFNKCLQYNVTGDTWTEIGSTQYYGWEKSCLGKLSATRTFDPLSPYFSGWRAWDFNPSVGLVIAGGTANVFGSEISRDYGVSFETLPLLPKALYAGCMTIVNSSQVFFLGGIDCTYSAKMKDYLRKRFCL